MKDPSEMFTSVDRDILVDLLLNGDNTPANIAKNTGRHKQSMFRRLPELEEMDLVKNKGNGVYALTDSGVTAAVTINRSL